MPELITISRDKLAGVEERARKLAREKSYLQLVNNLISKLSAVPGLENTVESIVRLILEAMGGSNVAVYYLVGSEIHYADAYSEKKILEAVDDDMVRKVFERKEFTEEAREFGETKMTTPEFTKASYWALPLMVGEMMIGVLKMEGMLMAAAEVREQLQPFFKYAALVLKNEIESHSKLREANDRLRRANESLKKERDESFRQRQFLEAVLDNTETGIAACDADGVLTLFNRKTRELHGLPQKPIPADEWARYYDLYLPDGRTPMLKEDIPLFRALKGKRVMNDEMMIIPKDGEPKTLIASGRIVRDQDGRTAGAVVSMHDITGRKKAEDSLRKAKEELEVRVAERTAELRKANEQLQVELAERKLAEEEITWNLAVNQALSSLYILLVAAGADIEQVAGMMAEKIRQLTSSAYGYVAKIDPSTGDQVALALTGTVHPEGKTAEKGSRTIRLPRGPDGFHPGLWGHALNTREPFYTNEPVKQPASGSIPEELSAVERFLAVPVLLNGELAGQIALANSARAYTDRDLNAVKRFAEFYALAIQRKRAEEELRRLNENLEKMVRERTSELEKKNKELERLNRVFVGRELKMIELKQQIKALESRAAGGGTK